MFAANIFEQKHQTRSKMSRWAPQQKPGWFIYIYIVYTLTIRYYHVHPPQSEVSLLRTSCRHDSPNSLHPQTVFGVQGYFLKSSCWSCWSCTMDGDMGAHLFCRLGWGLRCYKLWSLFSWKGHVKYWWTPTNDGWNTWQYDSICCPCCTQIIWTMNTFLLESTAM